MRLFLWWYVSYFLSYSISLVPVLVLFLILSQSLSLSLSLSHLSAVFFLFTLQGQVNEDLLQLLVDIIDTKLFEAIFAKDLKPVDVQDSQVDEVGICHHGLVDRLVGFEVKFRGGLTMHNKCLGFKVKFRSVRVNRGQIQM